MHKILYLLLLTVSVKGTYVENRLCFKVIRPYMTQVILVPRQSVTFPSWIPLGPGWPWSETQRHTSDRRDITKFKSSRAVLAQNVTEKEKFILSRPRHKFVWKMSVVQQQYQYSSALTDNSVYRAPKLLHRNKILHSLFISLLTPSVTWWRSWLRHCATSRKVAASIPDDVIGIFHWRNLSGRTMVLGLTQPLTEMSTRNISWGKGGRCLGLTTLPPSCADCLEIWEP